MNIEKRLCVLHLLDRNQQPLSEDKVYEALEICDFPPLEADLVLTELEKNNLIQRIDGKYQLSEEGLVVLHFFRDRLPLSLQEKIESLFCDQEPRSQWLHDYDPVSQRLFLRFVQSGEDLLNMDFFLEKDAYDLLLPHLSELNQEDFSKLKIFFLKE